MKKLLISLVGLILVLVAVVLVGPSFVDWNGQKSRLEAEVQKATGRKLTIEGDMNLALLPAPALTANSVSLQNIDGGTEASMIELEELKVRVALWPLLQGRVQFESVALVRPKILLEVLPDGRQNWQFDDVPTAPGAAQQGVSEVDSGAGGLSAAVRFDNFSIVDGTLVYRDGKAGREERFEQVNGNVFAESLQGPFAIKGAARARALAAEFDVTVGRLVESGATRIKAVLGLPEQDAQVEFSGTLSIHPDTTAFRGKLQGGGQNLASLVAAAMAAGHENDESSLPRLLANAFEVSANVTGDLGQAKVADLSLKLGEASFAGEIAAELQSPVRIKSKLEATKLDLDSLMTQARGSATTEAPAEEGAEQAGTTETVSASPSLADAAPLPENIEADLELSVDALVYRGQVIRQVRFEAGLSDGQATIRKAAALLPGGSDLTLSGNLRSDGQGLGFNGHLEALSDNLRAVLEWLGTDLSAVPADRLRRFAFSGDIAATTEQVTLQNLDMKVDVSRVLGGAVIALRDRPGLGIGLSVDRIDLDAYLGGSGDRSAGGSGDRAATSEQPAGGEADESREASSGGPGTGAGGLLNSFDANLDLRVGSLTYQETTAKTVRLNGTLQAGALTFKDASVADLAGNSGRYVGTLTGLGATPVLEGTLELRVGKPIRLAKLVNTDPKPFATIGPFNLNGNIKASLSEVAFNARVAALDGQFALDGTLQPLAAPVTFNVMLEGTHESLAKLTNRLAGRQLLGAGLGGLDARARLTGTPAQFKISDLRGTVGPSRLNGALSGRLSNGRFEVGSIDLSIVAKHANVAGLLGALSLDSPVSPALGGIDVAAKVTGSQSDLRVTGLKGRVGPIDLDGSLSANLAGSAPALSGVDLGLAVKHANLAELLAALSVNTPISSALGGIDLTGRVAGTQQDLRLSNLKGRIGPIAMAGSLAGNFAGPVPVVSSVNLNLDVRHPNLAQLTTALGRPGTVDPSFGGIDVRGHVVGTPSQLEIKELNGKIGPGELRGTVAADLRGAKPEIKLDLTTGPLPVAALLASAGGATGGGLGGSLSPRWSTKPIDLSALRLANADISLSSTALLYDQHRLDKAVVRAVLRDGVLDLQRFSGTIYNGAVQIAGQITAGNQLDVGLAVNAIEVELGPLLRQQGATDRVSGPLTLNANLSSRGTSEAELISRLNGQGAFSGRLTFKAKAEEAAGAALLAILGTQIKEVRGLADTSNTLLNAFAGAPAPLKGTFTVSNGQIRTSDARLDGRNAFALTNGAADLPSWQIQSRTDVYQNDNTQEPYLTAHLTGPIDEPNPRIQGGLLKRRQQAAPDQTQSSGPQPSGPQPSGSQPSGSQPQQPAQQAPQDFKDLKPKDILEQLLKGLNN